MFTEVGRVGGMSAGNGFEDLFWQNRLHGEISCVVLVAVVWWN